MRLTPQLRFPSVYLRAPARTPSRHSAGRGTTPRPGQRQHRRRASAQFFPALLHHRLQAAPPAARPKRISSTSKNAYRTMPSASSVATDLRPPAKCAATTTAQAQAETPDRARLRHLSADRLSRRAPRRIQRTHRPTTSSREYREQAGEARCRFRNRRREASRTHSLQRRRHQLPRSPHHRLQPLLCPAQPGQRAADRSAYPGQSLHCPRRRLAVALAASPVAAERTTRS